MNIHREYPFGVQKGQLLHFINYTIFFVLNYVLCFTLLQLLFGFDNVVVIYLVTSVFLPFSRF